MMQSSGSKNKLLFIRSGLVAFAVLAIVVAVTVMIVTPFKTFSYVVGLVLLVASAIMFGWSCRLGIVQRQV